MSNPKLWVRIIKLLIKYKDLRPSSSIGLLLPIGKQIAIKMANSWARFITCFCSRYKYGCFKPTLLLIYLGLLNWFLKLRDWF